MIATSVDRCKVTPQTDLRTLDTVPKGGTMSKDHNGGVFGGSLAGVVWFGGWLFTIGFAHLVWWKAILGLVVWPYFLAVYIR